MPIRVTTRRVSAPRTSPTLRAVLPFGLPQPPQEWDQKPDGVSLCMIVKNEERFLERCLQSAREMVDEIIVVDTGSTDGTVAIAGKYGARVEHREWRNDFGWARNEALALATRRWILVLDADEELLPESREALAMLKKAPTYLTGIWVRCYNEADDYQGTGAMSHALVRIFPNDTRVRYRGLIHEYVSVDGAAEGITAVPSPIAIVHHGYLKDVVKDRNKGERNLEIVQAATQADPGDPFNWFNLGMTAHLLGREDEAIEAFEKMRELNGDHPRGFIPNGLSTLADIYTERKRHPEKGLDIARLCLRFSPHYANAHFAIGKAYVELKRYDDARRAYLEAIDDGRYVSQQFVVDDEVSVWKAHCEIGTTYVLEGDDERAVEWFRKGIANRPSAAPIRLNLARALERLGRFSEAEELFARVYDEFGDEQATLQFVNFLLRRGADARALQVVSQSAERLPASAAVTALVAAAAVCQKRGWDGAQGYLERAAAIEPGNSEALNPLEALYRENGDSAALNALIQREESVAPKSAGDYLRRSQRCLADGAYEDALAIAQTGLSLADDGFLRYNAAIASVNLNCKHDALRHLDAVMPGTGALYEQSEYLKAVVLRELGELTQALAAVRRLLFVAPAQIDAIALEASLLEQLGNAPEAESRLRAALPLDRQRVSVELAGFYLRAGRLLDAKSVAEAALS